jgi:hypothetical protein
MSLGDLSPVAEYPKNWSHNPLVPGSSPGGPTTRPFPIGEASPGWALNALSPDPKTGGTLQPITASWGRGPFSGIFVHARRGRFARADKMFSMAE